MEVSRAQASSARGQAAQWQVNAWTTGGNLPDAIIRLQATPSTATAVFSFGCGTFDGTASCDLGAMDSKSRTRQLKANLTVPASDTGAKAATLTVIGSAAKLPHDPAASATVTLTTPKTPKTPKPPVTPATPPTPEPATSPLAVGRLPDLPTPSSTLSPGGNAAALFPALQPSAASSGGASAKTNVNKLAETSALPEGAPVVGAQLVGLGALALAFVLAITRLSIRRRPHSAPPAGASPGDPEAPAGKPTPADAPAEPAGGDAQQGTGEQTPENPSATGNAKP